MKKNQWSAIGAGLLFTGAVATIVGVATAAQRRTEAPPTVAFVDIPRYMGKWYEIARFPMAFERNCADVTAEYSLRPDGKVTVVNSCRKMGKNKRTSSKGVAWVVDRQSNAKLKVQFFWPFSGDYWIFDLGKDYEYAVVGSPKRNYVWILGRTPQMDSPTYEKALIKLRDLGFDLTRLEKTDQPEEKY